jgi:protein phosphatase
MHYRVGYATDIGQKRSQNQDSFAVVPELGLFIVADGMGGHRGGETASSMVVELVPKYVQGAQSKAPEWNPRAVITSAIQHANAAIYARAAEEAGLLGMGTTTTCLLFKNDLLTIGHVGDSRCYYLRSDGIWQATRDHSLVQEKLRAGLITREEMKTDRMKNVITRSVGFEQEVAVEIYEMKIQPGDIFLVCSDGLSGLLDDPDLLEVVQENLVQKDDIDLAVKKLIEEANSRGGDDNITVVVVQITEEKSQEDTTTDTMIPPPEAEQKVVGNG